MSEATNVDAMLNQAKQLEKAYDWMGAADSYEKALNVVLERDCFKRGEICERLGYAFHRAAMQAENVDEFRSKMSQAVAYYEKAKENYERLSEAGKTPRIHRCDAMTAYSTYWLTADVPEKKKLLHESWRLTKESLKAFEAAGDSWEYGRTFNQLITSAIFIFTLEWTFQEREKPMREGVEYGERAIKLLSTLEDSNELARAYAKTLTCLGVFGYYFQDGDEREACFQKGLGYWQKAKELSEETTMLEFLYPVFGSQIILGLEGTEEALSNYRKALEYGIKTKDRFIIGCALDWLTYHTFWKTTSIEDPDEYAKLLKRGLEYAEETKRQFSQISYVSPRADCGWMEGAYTEYHLRLAGAETDLKKKRALLEKALEAGKGTSKAAKDSGYPEAMMYVCNGSSAIRLSLAKIDTNPEEKKKLLEESLECMGESTRISQELEPFLYWNLGVGQGLLSNLKYELAELAKDPETKKNFLQEAVLHKDNSLKLGIKELSFLESKGSGTSLFAPLGESQYTYGYMLSRLYKLTNNKEHLIKAIDAFEDAIKSYQQLNLTSRIAECYWKIAQTYDTLEENLDAAQKFNLASNNYKKSAEKTPQLKNLYEDHVLYMQAWSEIEKAKHHHARQEYGLAKEHFENAANLHKSLKQWSYLAPNYSAWAQIECAEELSRKERAEEAIQGFEHAAKLFNESKESLQQQLSKIDNPDEKPMTINMVKATELRHRYCMARIAIEEAKILDKKGDHSSSSEKYTSAAETLQKITQALESEHERKEFKLITTLSRAWAKMTQAEAEEAPNLFTEASQLFEEAKELSPNEKARMLALGHSRFCRALEVGTRFADTRDAALLTSFMQHLESASNYYVRAGFQNASEYAKATRLLFEAYVHMDNAQKESDQEKKAKLYTMAEKVLQTSAGSFMKAEHPEKREQVLRLMEKVKEEQELALSLSEVLHAPSIVSTTTAFATPSPNHENAVGLERFENANIQANLVTNQKELKIGENLNLEIELINAGKGPALLTKITEVIPEGFELTEKPDNYRVEDSQLNMKGKRLDPLKTEEVKLVLRPKAQGIFPLKPKIMYLDENGKYKSHQPEPITITVKELGIKGWLKGER